MAAEGGRPVGGGDVAADDGCLSEGAGVCLLKVAATSLGAEVRLLEVAALSLGPEEPLLTVAPSWLGPRFSRFRWLPCWRQAGGGLAGPVLEDLLHPGKPRKFRHYL